MHPSASSARRWVLVSMVGILAISAYRGKLGQGDLAYRLWGVGMLGTMLAVAADFAPSVAGPFALLVLLGFATSGGDQAIQNLLGKISSGPAAAPSTPASAPATASSPGVSSK